MLSCKEAGRLFQEYLDKELTPEDIAKVEAHIHACAKCFGHMEFDKVFKKFVKQQSLQTKLSDDTKKLIQEKLRQL